MSDQTAATAPPLPAALPLEPATLPRRVGLLGGGVIGGGWAARFLLNGVDVQIFDPDPEAARKVAEVLASARLAMGLLMLAPLPAEGRLTFVDSPEAAAAGADFIQESAPEREDLKHRLLAAADLAADPSTVIATSTSGLLPTRLAEGLRHPERLCVGHPFNPVYLLPLVEVVGGSATAEQTVQRAIEVYRSVGMAPLLVRKEIDGFVADRLLEALWREALWLVEDGIATAAEIDDAIRFGAGLRWSFMGTFLTYRIAGGEAGMRHFMGQFGPALKWPWTKLMDVPELDDELLDRIVAQSDEQAAGASVRELERLRDRCLVAVLQGLRSQGYGAGQVVQDYERRLLARSHPAVAAPDQLSPEALAEPLVLHRTRIPAAWIDYNGHLHESRYLQVFGDATDALLRFVGVDDAYLASGRSYYTVETHLQFVRSLVAGNDVEVSIQVLSADQKRIQAFLQLWHQGQLVATAEHLYLHVDTVAQRATPAGAQVQDRVARIATAHSALPVPAGAGRRTGERAPR